MGKEGEAVKKLYKSCPNCGIMISVSINDDDMPFKSQAQRKYMYAKHPKLAKEFESKTTKKLPKKVKRK